MSMAYSIASFLACFKKSGGITKINEPEIYPIYYLICLLYFAYINLYLSDFYLSTMEDLYKKFLFQPPCIH